jgi:PhnB protein
MAVDPIPKGQPTVSPYISVRGAPQLLRFLESTFDGLATVMLQPDGRVAHAQVRIGDSVVMMGEAPADRAPLPAWIHVYVRDTDATYRRGLAAGGTSEMPPTDQFYGDRNCAVKDPCGNTWWIATHVEDVAPEEMQRRMAARAG